VVVIDHSPALLQRALDEWAHAGVSVVASRYDRGLSGARNTGIEVATGDVVLFLDDDAVAERDWVDRLVSAYADPRVLGVGGRVRPRWAGGRPAWFPREFDWVVGCSYRGLPVARSEIRNFIGANMSFRRDALTAAGGFRHELGRIGTVPSGCEETELCIRVHGQSVDGVLLYEPAAEVWHSVPSQRGTWSYFRSRCYAEGVSKAQVSGMVGARRGLSSELRYVLFTITSGIVTSLGRVALGRGSGVARALAMVVGLAATSRGYLAGRARSLRLSAALPDLLTATRRERLALLARVGAVPAAIVLWLASLGRIDLGQMGDLGLVPLLPITFWAALAVLLVSFCVQVLRPRSRTSVLVGHVLLLIAILHATPSILYGTLRYSWAWKHVGVTDFFMRHAGVDRSLRELSAYQYWPGFFTTNAMISKLAGLRGAEGYAIWAPPFFNALLLGPLFLIFSTFTRDRRLVWAAIGIFFLGSWVGQDYFAPQACCYFLFLTIVAVCIRYVRSSRPTSRALVPDTSVAPDRGQPLVLGAVVLMMAAIVPTHQLTPLVLIGALVVLALLCRQRRLALPLLLLVGITAAWNLLFAWPWLSQNLADIGSSFGQLGANANSGFINLATASRGQVLVAQMDRLLSVAVVALALVGFARHFRTRREVALPLLALTPVPLLFTSDYDGEMIFRIYLFGLPFAAFYAAAAFLPRETAGRNWWARVSLPLVMLLLVPGFAFSYYGKEEVNYFSPQELQAAELVYGIAPEGSQIVSATSDFPWGFTNYEMYDYERFALEDPRTRQQVLADPVGTLGDMMRLQSHHHSYLVLTRAQRFDVEMTGIMPPGSLDHIAQALLRSPDFVLLYQSPDAVVITRVGPTTEASS
jgi:hypothetical protein